MAENITMSTEEAIRAVLGNGSAIPEEMLDAIHDLIEKSNKSYEDTRRNSTDKSIFKQTRASEVSSDPDVYTNLCNLFNTDQKISDEFNGMLSSIYQKNRKYYSILRDYEIMPILIPQINRVLQFLVNETISPDIQNEHTFEMKYVGSKDVSNRIQDDLDSIRKEMHLDKLLRDVYTNRFRLGRELYQVTDYTKTFEKMGEILKSRMINEGAGITECYNALDRMKRALTETVDSIPCKFRASFVRSGAQSNNMQDVVNEDIEINFTNMNIVVERSPIVSCLEAAQEELLSGQYEKYSMDAMLGRLDNGFMNEDALTTDDEFYQKFSNIITELKRKKVRRCSIDRLDPSRTFPLKPRGKLIGYLLVSDISGATTDQYTSQFGQSLRDRLQKSRSNSYQDDGQNTERMEDALCHTLAEKIIHTFDPKIGLDRIEDIDLLHDFIMSNEVYLGNKKITFYYKEDIIDLSRTDESLLINAVFFTKLYAMLLLNNIMTKILRGRGRQIHTVQLGASNSVKKYLMHAIQTLNAPESNLGLLHGTFENLVNPLNSASDIIIPTEDGTERFITTDYIEGQNVDMDTDFLKFLLNSIVTSFGLDNAVLDATNGQLQFAKTLSMESLQICNSVKNEQADTYDGWKDLCYRVISIMGEDETRKALEGGLIEISFFPPKSLIMQNTLDEINNAKTQAEGIADIIPMFNTDNGDPMRRNVFVYMMVKKAVNMDWGAVERLLKEAQILAVNETLDDLISQTIQNYQQNTETRQLGDETPEEKAADQYALSDEEADEVGVDEVDDSVLEEGEPGEEEEAGLEEEQPEEGEAETEEPETETEEEPEEGEES